ncbi:twin-arginine translocation signal domain-containing protein [Bradyrhizobium sp. Ghvi]|nr:twin-arginine translocation signal domain-containing protein [Bradyrhizobium sp. Ghvi]
MPNQCFAAGALTPLAVQPWMVDTTSRRRFLGGAALAAAVGA